MLKVSNEKGFRICIFIVLIFLLHSNIHFESFAHDHEEDGDVKEVLPLYRAAILEDFPPMYKVNIRGAHDGYSVEMAKNIGEIAGFNVEFVVAGNWEEAMEMVDTGEADFIPGIGVNDVRAQRFAFSETTETEPVVIFVRRGNTKVSSIEDLHRERTGVVKSSVPHDLLNEQHSEVKQVLFENVDSGLVSLLSGEIEAFIIGESAVLYKVRDMGIEDRVSIVGDPLVHLRRAFLVRRDEPSLLVMLNQALREYKSSEEYLANYEKWYGEEETGWSTRRIIITGGTILGLFAAYTTSRHLKQQRSIKLSEKRYRSILTFTNTGAWEYYRDRDYQWCSPQYFSLLGYDPEEVKTEQQGNLKEIWTKWVHEEDRDKALSKYYDFLENPGDGIYENVFRMRRKDGSYAWILSRGSIVESKKRDKSPDIIGAHIDITETKEREQTFEKLSYYDYLTGLHNRRYFDNQLEKLDHKKNYPITVIFGDINGTKVINDSLGNIAGDRLIRKVGEIFKSTAKDDEVVVRMGGDDFAVICIGKPEGEIKKRIQEISKKVEDLDFNNSDELVGISIAMGYAVKSDPGISIGNLITRAEEAMYKRKIYDRRSLKAGVIDLVMNSLFQKSIREKEHSERVGKIAEKVGRALELGEEEIRRLEVAATFHDIGKIGIPDDVLNKPGKLNDEEWIQMRSHPEKGWRMLANTKEYDDIAQFVMYHHERWDGKGYPKGLEKEEIPLEARIIGIVDAFDAMTEQRTYKNSLTKEEALAELTRCAGSQFDPDIVQIIMEKKVLDSVDFNEI